MTLQTDREGHKKWNWRLFFVLWIAAVVGVVLVLPYAFSKIPADMLSKAPPMYILVPAEIVQGGIILGVITLAGLFFANRIGLGAPILEAWLDGQEVGSKLRSILVPSVLIGVIGTLVIIGLEILVFEPAIRNQSPVSADAISLWNEPAAWKGLLASFEGGIDEEIELRLFAMSFFAWLGAFVFRKAGGTPTSTVLWSANVIAAVLFGIGHLPLISAMAPLTGIIVLRTIVLNGLLGIAFGYLYWKRGLESAMLAHFSADLLLHVVLAF
jgi:membrane protease YdiL (CAAX protease family)